jgi:peroxiredoxin
MSQISLLGVKSHSSFSNKISNYKRQMKKVLLAFLLGMIVQMTVLCQGDPTTLLKTGDKAPLFICKTIDGKTIDLSKLKGKIVMINFFATWCGPCNQELPVLQENIWNKYKDNPNFVLIILGREHTEQEIMDFVAKKKFTMPFAPDQGREIFKLYASQSIPRNIIIDRDGNIFFQNIGFSFEEFKKLELLLAEKIK